MYETVTPDRHLLLAQTTSDTSISRHNRQAHSTASIGILVWEKGVQVNKGIVQKFYP